jgi:hypothetical protein
MKHIHQIIEYIPDAPIKEVQQIEKELKRKLPNIKPALRHDFEYCLCLIQGRYQHDTMHLAIDELEKKEIH